MRFENMTQATDYIFQSIAASGWQTRGLDEDTRDPRSTAVLLEREGLLKTRREYAVVTGSKGKGSVTVMTANILKHIGHRVGMIISPHLVDYRERIRVDGKMIPEADFLRILESLAPSIDIIVASLTPPKYLSPTGIFLAIALRWFDEQDVEAAVVEVGRGGRFDDNALVPNMLSLITPIVLEHNRYLGERLERIAWHKAGIIKPQSYVYSLPQSPEVMDVLRNEAESHEAQFDWLAPMDIGQFIAPLPNGVRMSLSRYGEIDLPFIGRYEIDNATLASWGAGNIHGRLGGISHGSSQYVEAVRKGLETAIWPGRCQKLQGEPDVYIDGAINPISARLFLESVRDRLRQPVTLIAAIPIDRDAPAVYRELLSAVDSLVITRSARNITINFPSEADAVRPARAVAEEIGKSIDIRYSYTVADAIELGRALVGLDGSVIMAVAQPAIGDTFEFYHLTYEQI
jgi:dihydrofolate synthase/folylpolyglutamate synthase